MQEWFSQHAWTIGVVSTLMFVVGIISLPFFVGRIRADYFLQPEAPASSWQRRHPAIRLTVLILKNTLGVLLLLAGLAMLLLPGQGVLTILIGITLLDFPGKRRLEFWIIRRRGVLTAVNWIREKANRPPLQVYNNDP